MIELFPFGMWHPYGINIIPTRSDRVESRQIFRLVLGLCLGLGSGCTYISIDA